MSKWISRQKQQEKLAILRNDPLKTQARYDEIVKLRMLLLDILESQDPIPDYYRKRIDVETKKWGGRGDCC